MTRVTCTPSLAPNWPSEREMRPTVCCYDHSSAASLLILNCKMTIHLISLIRSPINIPWVYANVQGLLGGLINRGSNVLGSYIGGQGEGVPGAKV